MTPPHHYGLHFDRSLMAIAAAVDGLGVVLESTLLGERELRNGTLVSPLFDSTQEIRYIGHYLVYPKRLHHHAAFEVFKTWLLDQLGIDEKGEAIAR
jgi:DNA-binding transcriptional LysR family regulator